MVWLPFATEEPPLPDDSTRRKKTHKRNTTPIVISAHYDDSSDDSLESIPRQPDLVSLTEKVDISDARSDRVVRDGGDSEIREQPSSPQRFHDKYAAPAQRQDSDTDYFIYDTGVVVKDEGKSFDEGYRGELICIVRHSSSSSEKELASSVASQSTEEESVSIDMPQEGVNPSVSLEKDEQPATKRTGKRQAVVVLLRKAIASHLGRLKAKRRKTVAKDKIVPNQLESLGPNHKEAAALDQILEENEEAPLTSEVVSTVPISSNVKTSVENDGVELTLNRSSMEDEAAVQPLLKASSLRSAYGSSMEDKAAVQPLLKASSLKSAAPSDLENQSDEEASRVSSHGKEVMPPYTMNTITPDVTTRTIGVIPEPLPSNVESDASKQTSRDSSDVTPFWSFIACCSFAYFCCNKGESNHNDCAIQDSALPPTEDENVESMMENDLSITNNGSDANAHRHNDENTSQGAMSEPISLSEEPTVRKSSTESHKVVSKCFRQAASRSNDIMESVSSLRVKRMSNDETSQTSVETDVEESPKVDECKTMAVSFEKKASNEASLYSQETKGSDAMSGLKTSFDSHDTSLPWWETEEFNSVDSQGWSDSMIDGIWTVPTLTEYSRAYSMTSESQFSTLSFETYDELASTASFSELDEESIENTPKTSASKDSTSISSDRDIKPAKSTPKKCDSNDSASIASDRDIEPAKSTPKKCDSNDSASISSDRDIEPEKGRDTFAAEANDKERACEASDIPAKDSNDAPCERQVTREKQEQTETSSILESLKSLEHGERPDEFAQWAERKRIRVFSKSLSQNVARNIQRRASKMKAKKAARRNQIILVKSGHSMDEELPAIEETNESSNASSASSLGVETQVTWTKSGIELDDATIRDTNIAKQQMCPPPEPASPKSVTDIKLMPSEIVTTDVSDHLSVPPVTSSFDDASNGELEMYVI